MTSLFIFEQIKTGGQIPMRWLFARQRRQPLSCQDGFSCRTVSGLSGEKYSFSIPKNPDTPQRAREQSARIRAGFCYLASNVNNFTYSGHSSFSRSFCMSYSYVPSSQRPPSRTIRRVHVMPWATPIRRIGAMRINCIGPEDDDPAGSGRRRFVTTGV